MQLRIYDAPAPALIFLHIPKTAGCTLRKIVDRQFLGQATFVADSSRLQASVAEFKALSEDERSRFRLVSGHFDFGLHAWLPQPSTYLTVLRDPRDRIVSMYYYILRSPLHYLHDRVVGSKWTLRAFAESRATLEIDNHMVRMLASAPGESHGTQVPIGAVSQPMLDVARRHLIDYFSVVGIMEEFDKSLALMNRTYGWNVKAYDTLNVTPNRPRLSDISAADREAIEKCHQLDMELYETARHRFQELCAACDLSGADRVRDTRSWLRRAAEILPRISRRAA